MKDGIYGAVVERGRISADSIDGYEVESLDRRGIVAPSLRAVTEQTFAVGEIVYFFLFPDGTGKILCSAQG